MYIFFRGVTTKLATPARPNISHRVALALSPLLRPSSGPSRLRWERILPAPARDPSWRCGPPCCRRGSSGTWAQGGRGSRPRGGIGGTRPEKSRRAVLDHGCFLCVVAPRRSFGRRWRAHSTRVEGAHGEGGALEAASRFVLAHNGTNLGTCGCESKE